MSAVSERWSTEPAVGAGGRTSRFDQAVERVAALGVAVLIAIGFTASYTTLRDLAAVVGGFPPWLAPVVPLSFDVGIVVLSLKVVLAARAGRRARLLRTLVITLSALTVLANGAASPTWSGRLLHAVPPAMFVICFETVAAGARRTATDQFAQRAHEPELPLARWLLAPRETWHLWRARVLAGPVAAPARGPHEQAATADRPPRGVATGAEVEDEVTDDRRRCRERAPAGTVPAAPLRPGRAPHGARLDVAVAELRRRPRTTAVALADVLRAAGHEVSVRTAQRVRSDAERILTEAPS
ncbi:DUF2637 domain-containing protein [Kineococcus sp. SYSU DK004]|uniref:DUF2637 domain-containing protein n=1 Tax=Kineococcus sp. SYSU DK004 TaxID=3383125 RepID=UPI003D7EC773